MGLWHVFAPVPLAMLTKSLQSGSSLGLPCTLVMAAGQPSLLALQLWSSHHPGWDQAYWGLPSGAALSNGEYGGTC